MAQPWFLKAINNYSYGTLEIEEFTISYGATSFTALGLPWRAPTSSSGSVPGYLMVPEPPRLVAETPVTTPTTLAPNTNNVTLAVTVRNLGSATQGALNGTLTLKAPTTGADVTSLAPASTAARAWSIEHRVWAMLQMIP